MATAHGTLPFAEQIAFFRRKVNLPTSSWTQIWQSEHDHAFVVAGVNRIDMLADFRAAVDKAISQGTTLEAFRKDFDTIVAKYGWDYNGGRNWRSRVIYETNLRTSYAAGRYAQLQALKPFMPYWEYVHSDAVQHPRPLHLSWNKLVLRADDPWWNTHFGPNGWGCQCTVRARSKRDLAKLGKDGPDQAPPIDWQTVTVGARGPNPRVVQTPAGVDPGFGYAPGKDAFERLAQLALDKTMQLPAEQAAEAAEEFLGNAAVRDAVEKGFADFLNDMDRSKLGTQSYDVGALTQDLVAAMREQGIDPSTAAIVARDLELDAGLNAPSTSNSLPRALTQDELAQLPALLGKPTAVLLDAKAGYLLYVFNGSADGQASTVVSVKYGLQSADGEISANTFSSATLMSLNQVRDIGGFVVLQGKL